jgi:O-acetyl-ADP-ribose deacetylase (regulator of RNase III)
VAEISLTSGPALREHAAGDQPPTHSGLVEELRHLRERGITGIRDAVVPELTAAARLAGYDSHSAGVAAAIERLIRKAVDRLGDGTLAQAAAYTFGTRPGFRDKPARDRREQARKVYGVSAERFRRAQERVVISQVADAVLELSSRAAAVPPAHGELPASWTREIRCAGRSRTVRLRIGPVALLRDVDVVVTSTNVYFALSHVFVSSLSAALRGGAAVRDEENGQIVNDVVALELDAALDRAGTRGLAAVPGSVRMTSSGRLVRQGIHRILHAAVAVPSRSGPVRYEVEPAAIAAAMQNTFRLAARLQASELPALSSICFPLFGAGCGAVDRQQSLRWMLSGLEQELPADAPWAIHLLSRSGAALDLSDWTRLPLSSG